MTIYHVHRSNKDNRLKPMIQHGFIEHTFLEDHHLFWRIYERDYVCFLIIPENAETAKELAQALPDCKIPVTISFQIWKDGTKLAVVRIRKDKENPK